VTCRSDPVGIPASARVAGILLFHSPPIGSGVAPLIDVIIDVIHPAVIDRHTGIDLRVRDPHIQLHEPPVHGVPELNGEDGTFLRKDRLDHVSHVNVERSAGWDEGNAGSAVMNQVVTEGTIEIIPMVVLRVRDDLLSVKRPCLIF